ncbi:hypothetical protein AYO44_04765 [Planctomycetaceae bacterium SCGC AG-212-F19]|nr:hypothetical protein AYO44_04765 [Planctomycetaceae bacterium SCGC AG-212-F19]
MPPPVKEPAKESAVSPQAAIDTAVNLSLDATARELPQSGEAAAWHAAPPPVRRAPATDTIPVPTAPTEDWLAPPVPAVSESAPAPTKAPATKRYGVYFIVVCLLAIAGMGAWFFLHGVPDQEEVLREEAEALFTRASQNKEYDDAARLFDKLARSFPQSDRVKEYGFYAELCRLLQASTGAVVFADKVMETLCAFLKKYAQDTLLDKNRLKVTDVYRNLLERHLDDTEKVAEQKPIPSSDLKRIEDAIATVRKWRDEAKPYWPEGDMPLSIRERIAELERKLAKARERARFLAALDKMEKPALKDIENVRLRARDLELVGDAEVEKRIDALIQKAIPSVEYVRNPDAAKDTVAPTPVGLVVVPRLDTNPTPLANHGVVFALVRGILYALAENDGHVLWATRVGIDTHHLPVRLPPTETTTFEIALVLSSDSNTLTARRITDGQALWRHNLGNTALGRPVVVERRIVRPEGGDFLSRRVYVATIDGRVQEIEIASGNLLGEYRCGLPLLVGGARQPGSTLLYFPADRGYVFVFDVAQQRCVGVIRTGHPSGSLRGEPILVGAPQPGKPKASPAYQVLCQTDGLERMRLRAFQLPHDWAGQEPTELKPPPDQRGDRPWTVPGWLWFEPRCDGEKIALVTDAGVLGLFGVNQLNNADSAVFPLLGKNRPTIPLVARGAGAGRALVIHTTENDFWLLSQGEAQHWRLGWTRRDGLTVGSEWPRPVVLGSPLHAGQVNAAGDSLFMVTQANNGPVCLATAVDATTGNIRWQRQLGVIGAHDPVPVAGKVLMVDQGGGLVQFDPVQFPADSPKLPVQDRVLAPGSAPLTDVFVIPGKDGAYIIGSLARNQLLVRRYVAGKKADDARVDDLSFAETLAGTPALVGGMLIYPHGDGLLRRLVLTKNTRATLGQQWRDAEADADAPGHVVHLDGDDFLYTDGSRGLFRLSWGAADPIWRKKELKTPPLERIVAAPLVLSAKPPRVCVADASGTVTLLQGDFLQKERSWQLPGKVTAGPVRRGKLIVCVVDRKRIVAIDPEKQELAWSYTDPDGAVIVGLPQAMGDRLLVAHLHGRIVSVDLPTGQPRGKGFTIQASAAPAATPVPFGEDRIFAPLTDGSVLLIALDEWEAK